MTTTLADQYLAQNAGRRYPLADDAGYDGIPDDTAILDFRCTVRGVPAGTAPVARIVEVDTAAGSADKTVTVVVDRPDGADVLVFTLQASMASGAPYSATAVDADTGAEGTLVVSRSALSIPDGRKDVQFTRTTVVCDSLKVDSVQSAQGDDATDQEDPDGRDATAVLTGDIVLAEGRNTEPYLDENHLRLDIFKGAGLGERCQSAAPVAGRQRCDTVLFTINGERPGTNGDLRLVGEDGIKVTADRENHAVEIRMDDVAADRMADGCAPACPAAK